MAAPLGLGQAKAGARWGKKKGQATPSLLLNSEVGSWASNTPFVSAPLSLGPRRTRTPSEAHPSHGNPAGAEDGYTYNNNTYSCCKVVVVVLLIAVVRTTSIIKVRSESTINC